MHNGCRGTLIISLIITSSLADINKTKNCIKNKTVEEINADRGKRSLSSDVLLEKDENNDGLKYDSFANNERIPKSDSKLNEDFPFWGTRGRRDSREDSSDISVPSSPQDYQKSSIISKLISKNIRELLEATVRHKIPPIWHIRENMQNNPVSWDDKLAQGDGEASDNRDRRQDTEPFWGARGRREESEPFWGNRGRRDDEPFWGTRGRREESSPFWGNRGRRRDDNYGNNNFERDSFALTHKTTFWGNQGRDNRMKYLFDGSPRPRFHFSSPSLTQVVDHQQANNNKVHSSTLLDDRMYAEQPHFILVERNSRSSGEDDPYFISRGKKKFLKDFNLEKAARDRRGDLEEIVKSVRNDPYYIARGKKNEQSSSNSYVNQQLVKGKDLICATIDLVALNSKGKVKREIDERDRRDIIRKLAAKLQADPFYVSRGKKNYSPIISDEKLEGFLNDVSEMCT